MRLHLLNIIVGINQLSLQAFSMLSKGVDFSLQVAVCLLFLVQLILEMVLNMLNPLLPLRLHLT
jgi:hypothetical protein